MNLIAETHAIYPLDISRLGYTAGVMRIYTRTGDTGETGLYGGQRVRKDDLRVGAYGTVDEANAALGVAAATLENDPELRTVLFDLQRDLFTVGADLATPLERDATKAPIPRITPDDVQSLESLIDHFEETLPALQNFILPGGTLPSAYLHLARTLVRRAERDVVTLLHDTPDTVNDETMRYLNRLADLLFVLARAANARAGVSDVPWSRQDAGASIANS